MRNHDSKSERMNSHRERLFTAGVLIVVLVIAVTVQAHALFGVILLASALGQWEFYSMVWPGRDRVGRKLWGLALGAGLIFACNASPGSLVPGVLLAGFWTASLTFLFRYDLSPKTTVYGGSLLLLAGLLYLPLHLQFCLQFSRVEMVLVLLAAVSSDTAAYYAGTYWGERKLWPAVSPKKTWAGLWGGLAACVLAILALGLSFGKASWWAWLLLGFGLGLAACLGDLFESALKRRFGVKDSGTLLPGHGGLLDRMDGFLFVVFLYGVVRPTGWFF